MFLEVFTYLKKSIVKPNSYVVSYFMEAESLNNFMKFTINLFPLSKKLIFGPNTLRFSLEVASFLDKKKEALKQWRILVLSKFIVSMKNPHICRIMFQIIYFLLKYASNIDFGPISFMKEEKEVYSSAMEYWRDNIEKHYKYQ